MLRAAFTARGIVAFFLLVVFTAATIALGIWQWDRSQSILAVERAALAAPVDIAVAVPPGARSIPVDALGRSVTARGAFDPESQVAIVNRSLDDRPGVWIVNGLQLDDGRTLAVVRGWAPDASSPQTVAPTGTVQLSGVLQPDEKFYSDAPASPGTDVTISSKRLQQAWGGELVPGFVVLEAIDPVMQPSPDPVPPTVQVANVPFPLQNFFYAFQWWLFAVLGWVVYLRWLYVESRKTGNTIEG